MLPAMASFCGQCGSPLQEGDHFCRNCGTRVDNVAPVGAASEAAQPIATPTETPAEVAPIGAPPTPPPTGNKGPLMIIGALALVGIAIVVVLLLTRGGGNEAVISPAVSPIASQSPSPSPSPTDGKEPKPKLADARLRESWQLDYRVKSASSSSLQGTTTHYVFHFDPHCTDGACDVTMSTEPTIVLQRNAAAYKGDATANFGSTCNSAAIPSHATVFLRVTRAAMKDGKWTATKLTGTVKQTVAAQQGCEAVKVAYNVSGHPTTKPWSKTSGIPGIVLSSDPPTPEAASQALLSAWRSGSRSDALDVANASAVDDLFAIPASYSKGLMLSGCGGTKCSFIYRQCTPRSFCRKYPSLIFYAYSTGSGYRIDRIIQAIGD